MQSDALLFKPYLLHKRIGAVNQYNTYLAAVYAVFLALQGFLRFPEIFDMFPKPFGSRIYIFHFYSVLFILVK